MNIDELQNLLDNLPERKIKNPTFFEITKYPHYENVCSNLLQFFLDPQSQVHQLGDIMLQSFFDVLKYEIANIVTPNPPGVSALLWCSVLLPALRFEGARCNPAGDLVVVNAEGLSQLAAGVSVERLLEPLALDLQMDGRRGAMEVGTSQNLDDVGGAVVPIGAQNSFLIRGPWFVLRCARNPQPLGASLDCPMRPTDPRGAGLDRPPAVELPEAPVGLADRFIRCRRGHILGMLPAMPRPANITPARPRSRNRSAAIATEMENGYGRSRRAQALR